MNLLSVMTLIAKILLIGTFHLTYASDGLSTHFEFVPELFPREPVALSGTTLVINCTLRSANVDLESNLLLRNLSQLLTFDLQFPLKDLSTDVQHVGDRTIQLCIYSVQRQMSGGRVSCGVKGRRDSADNVTVVIADAPGISEMPDCVVYNQRYMTCTWPEPDTGIPTIYRLLYNKEFRPVSWSACPEPAPHRCTWPEKGNGMFVNVQFYHIRRSAQNQLGSWSKDWKFNVTDIVKPDAVTNVRVRNLTSRSAVVTWTEPCLVGAKTVTRITYSSDCDSLTACNVTSPKNQMSLLNLVPSAVYTLTVACRQVVVGFPKGFWSDSVTLLFQTLPDVPGQNPSVFHETFSSTSQTTELDTVEIFWEPVPICLRHDNTSSVEIFYRPAENTTTSNLTVDTVIKDSVDWSSLSASKHSVSAGLPLPTAFDYEVVVLARTSLGYNHLLPLVPLFVPKSSNRPRLNGSLIVTRNYTEVTVHLPSESIDRVYWCYTSVNSRKCQMPLIWKNVGNGIRDLKLQFDKPDLLMFAVRAQFNNSSPGVTVSDLKWSDCIYNVNKGVMKPTEVKFSRHNAPLSLALEWTEPSCMLSSYITHYYVHYCRLNASNCTDNILLVITAPATRAVINNLAPASVYQARVMSGSMQENSSFTNFVVSENVAVVLGVKSSDDNSKTSVDSIVAVVISTVVLVLIALAIVLGVWCFMRCRQIIPIKTPVVVKPDFSATDIVRSSTCLVDGAAICLYRSTLPEHSVPGDNAPEQFDNDTIDIGAPTPEQQSLLVSQSASVSSDRAVSAVIS